MTTKIETIEYTNADGTTVSVPVGGFAELPAGTNVRDFHADGVCPHCGYCKHCGRGGHQPVYPMYPTRPPYYIGDPPGWFGSTTGSFTVT